jgi:predicted nucleic acid-binding protein
MDRVFLDANVLFSAAYRPRAGVLQLWDLDETVLCSSRYALEEARSNLEDDSQQARLARLSKSILFFDVAAAELPGGIALPQKDLPILLAAIAADATHLITGDERHFGAYFHKSIQGILVLSPRDYLISKKRL